VKVDELLNILHFQHDVALKCTCKFSTFKYYSGIHQTSNGKVCLKLNLTNHFQTYLLSIFSLPKFHKFCNHLIINSKKGTILLLCYFQLLSIYFLLLLSKIGPLFDCFGNNYFFRVFYHAFTPINTIIVTSIKIMEFFFFKYQIHSH
jgi:hypothetical protein